jgi:hypothetical protein
MVRHFSVKQNAEMSVIKRRELNSNCSRGKEYKLLDRISSKITFILVLFVLASTISVRIGASASQPSGIRLSWTQDATNTTMTIMWETDSFGNPNEVQYGLTTACELNTSYGFSFADSWGVYYNHQVNITGLSSNHTTRFANQNR